MKILLFGLIGSGKTTVGQALAKELNADFIEMDAVTLERSGFDSTEEVYAVRRSLWQELELDVSRDISTHANATVVACSGDIVENELNLEYFRENSAALHIVYLKASPEVLAKRIIGSHPQATQSDQERITNNIQQLFNDRNELYTSHSMTVIDTDNLLPADVVKQVLAEIQK